MPHRSAPDPSSIEAATRTLCDGRRPLLMLGGGVVEADGNAVAELASLLSAAIVPSNAGKGIVPDSHPLNLCTSMVRTATQRFVGQCNVVLALGTAFSETDSYIDRLPLNRKLIRIDIDPAKINDLYPADIGIVADAARSLTALLNAVKTLGPRPSADAPASIAAGRESCQAELSAGERQHQSVCRAIRIALPEDAIIIADMTQIAYSGSYVMPVERPRTWLHAAGFCTLGCALPMAIGAKIAVPDREVAIIAGDGGFMFTLEELAAAVELNQSLPIILWNNDGYGQIRDRMTQRDIPFTGVNSVNPDFTMLAKAFGCDAVRPQNLEAITDSVRAALLKPRPTLIEVHQSVNW